MTFGIRKILSIFSFIILFASCVDETNELGKDLVKGSDVLGANVETGTEITAYSVTDDTLRTAGYQPVLLGAYNDAVFGTTEASLYTQFQIDKTARYEFSSTTVLDSVILSFAYTSSTSIYPDNYDPASDQPITLKVYEVLDNMYKDSSYYSNSNLQYQSTPIGTLTFHPSIKDSVVVSGVKRPPHFRIVLDKTWAKKFIDADPSVYSNYSNFANFFKGFYVKPDNVVSTNQACITYLNLKSTITRLTLFYRKNGTADAESFTSAFQINDSCMFFNNYKHNYSLGDSKLANQINNVNPDTTLGKQKLFLQTMGGVNIKIAFTKIPEVLKNKDVIINEASLILPIEFAEGDKNIPIGQLNVYKILAGGGVDLLPDHSVTKNPFEYLDGKLHDKKYYRLRITRYFQRLALGIESDNNLLIVPDLRRSTANRSVFNGTSATDRVRLEVIYTYK